MNVIYGDISYGTMSHEWKVSGERKMSVETKQSLVGLVIRPK